MRSRLAGAWTVALSMGFLAARLAHAGDVCFDATFQHDKFEDVDVVTVEGVGHTVRKGTTGVFLEYVIAAPGETTDPIPAGLEFQWVLENQARVVLVSHVQANPTKHAFATQYVAGVVTRWLVEFPLSPEILHAVAQSRPAAARFAVGQQVSYDFSDNEALALQRHFACVANQVPLDHEVEGGKEELAPPPPAKPAASKSAKSAAPKGKGPAREEAEEDTIIIASKPLELDEDVADAEEEEPSGEDFDAESGGSSASDTGTTGAGWGWNTTTVAGVGAVVTGLAAGAFFAESAVLRSQFEEEPSQEALDANHTTYWTSVALGGVSGVCAGVFIAGRF